MATNQTSGVRWSGLSDERPWTPSPEAQARAYAAHLKAKEAQEAEVAAYAAERKAQMRGAA